MAESEGKEKGANSYTPFGKAIFLRAMLVFERVFFQESL